jgi:hypothetical protein
MEIIPMHNVSDITDFRVIFYDPRYYYFLHKYLYLFTAKSWESAVAIATAYGLFDGRSNFESR